MSHQESKISHRSRRVNPWLDKNIAGYVAAAGAAGVSILAARRSACPPVR